MLDATYPMNLQPLGPVWCLLLTSDKDQSRQAGKGRDINSQAFQGP